jgi:hypothetical protein
LALFLCLAANAADYTGTIHWDQVKGEISEDLFSMNLFAFPITNRVASAKYRGNVRYMKPAILRLHNAGTTRDEGGATLVDPVAKDWDYEKITTILNHLKDIPGDRMFNIVHFPSWMDEDDDKMLDEDQYDAFAGFCADLVRFTNKEMSGTYIKYWEVTNERDHIYGNAGKIRELAKTHNQAYDAMKAIDSTILIGGPAFVRPDIVKNRRGFIDGTWENLDFISGHGYATGSARFPDDKVYDKVDRLVGHMKALGDYCRTKTDRHIPVFWDEFNISWTWRSWDARMKTNKGACFDALCYIGAIKAGLDGLFPWNECDGIYGKMGNKFELRPPAHSINLLATHVRGSWVETLDAPTVKMLGVINGTRKVIVIVNRSGEPHSIALTFTGWSSEPAGDAPVEHHVIDGSGKSRSALSYSDLTEGVSLSPHTVHALVFDSGTINE